MIAELGHLALVLALATALYQMSIPLYGAHSGDLRLMRAAVPAALTQLLLIAFAFAALTLLIDHQQMTRRAEAKFRCFVPRDLHELRRDAAPSLPTPRHSVGRSNLHCTISVVRRTITL
jgi:hypothetical protein